MEKKEERRQRIVKSILTKLEQENCTAAEARIVLQDVRDIILLTARVTSSWPVPQEQVDESIAEFAPTVW